VPHEYRKLFENMRFPDPPNYDEETDPYADAWARFRPGERARLGRWRKNYYAMTANLDRNVGRLMQTLDALGLADNTIVVFTSDHGEMFGAHGRRAKNIFYEEAIRVPFLIRGPAIPAGIESRVCISSVDIMPTLLGLLGLPAPREVEGMDLSHLVRGEAAAPAPEFAFLQNTGACADWEDGHEWRAVRDLRYTYAVFRVDHGEFLFDNTADPWQMTNLAENNEFRAVLEKQRTRLASKMAEIEDTFEACTWYREHWTDGNRNILRGARG
jgi:arylsulfatase A-like enzyme